MRLIKIPNIILEDYEVIQKAIMDVIPFSIINQAFVFDDPTPDKPNNNEGTAYFNFWDVEYIPEQLRKYIVQPPLSRENKELLHKRLLEVLK